MTRRKRGTFHVRAFAVAVASSPRSAAARSRRPSRGSSRPAARASTPVQLDEAVDERRGTAPAPLAGRGRSPPAGAPARMTPGDAAHDVEVAADHRRVVAEGDHLGDERVERARAPSGRGTRAPCRAPTSPSSPRAAAGGRGRRSRIRAGTSSSRRRRSTASRAACPDRPGRRGFEPRVDGGGVQLLARAGRGRRVTGPSSRSRGGSAAPRPRCAPRRRRRRCARPARGRTTRRAACRRSSRGAPRPWMARSRTRCIVRATVNLMREISSRAARAPSFSIFQAACRTISRAAWISARLSAIHCWTICFVPSGRPGGELARRRVAAEDVEAPARRRRSSACSGGCGPGPSRSCAMREAGALRAEQVRERHARVRGSSPRRGSPSRRRARPSRRGCRRASKPGVSGRDEDHARAPVRVGGLRARHRHADRRRRRRRPTTRTTCARGGPTRRRPAAPSCPSQTGFEPANSGSVIVKQLRISPRTSGRRKRSFCSGGAVLHQELHVPDVRRLHVEEVVAERAPARAPRSCARTR